MFARFFSQFLWWFFSSYLCDVEFLPSSLTIDESSRLRLFFFIIIFARLCIFYKHFPVSWANISQISAQIAPRESLGGEPIWKLFEKSNGRKKKWKKLNSASFNAPTQQKTSSLQANDERSELMKYLFESLWTNNSFELFRAQHIRHSEDI